MKKLIFTILIVTVPLLLFAQYSYNGYNENVNPNSKNNAENLLDTALSNIFEQIKLFPQEKIYIQTDKPYYISGEKIFFRIFLLNAFLNIPSDMSRYVYIELIDPLNSLVLRQQIRSEEGLFYGTILLPEDLPRGDYKIRAYTRLMENMSNDYFYVQYIRIGDPLELLIETEAKYEFLVDNQIIANIRFTDSKEKTPLIKEKVVLNINDNKKSTYKTDENGEISVKFKLAPDENIRILFAELNTDSYTYRQYIRIPYPDNLYSVSFYPEGGNFVAGKPCRIAFKSLKSDGNPEEITGKIFDSRKLKITDFTTSHNGMGDFILAPDAGEKYYAACYNKNGDSITVNLPEVKTNAISLKTALRHSKLWIDVNIADNTNLGKLYLLIYSGGIPVYLQEWANKSVVIDKLLLSSGISSIYLLTEDYTPLSRRIVFILNNDWASAKITPHKNHYRTRDLVKMDIEVIDGENSILADSNDEDKNSNFSISIVDAETIVDTTSNILSGILLCSELKGYVHNPAYYFQTNNSEINAAADLLMMVNGWNRYDIPKAMKGNFEYAKIPAEKSQSISGIVKGGLFLQPHKGANVILASMNPKYAKATDTDDNGNFGFEGFEFADTTKYIIQALNKRGKNYVSLYLNDTEYPHISESWNIIGLKENDFNYKEYLTKAEEKYIIENGERITMLPSAVIQKRMDKSKYRSVYELRVEQVITEKEIKENPPWDIYDLFTRFPFLERAPGNIIYNRLGAKTRQGPLSSMSIFSSKASGYSPEIYVDKSRVFSVEHLDPDNIAYVSFMMPQTDSQILKYGSGVANGVIEIVTKNGLGIDHNKIKDNIVNINSKGYSVPVEFYSPKYDTPEAIASQIPDLRSTIYWQPNVLSDKQNKASIEFYTADSQTEYTVTLEGIAPNGTLIYHREKAAVSVK